MLSAIFEWFDHRFAVYWVLAGLASLLLAFQVLSAIRQESGGRATPRPGTSWRDAVVLFLFLLGWRWPFLLAANEFNPDESQLIAGAISLTRDPVFWRSVDGTTSGPLNFYVLLPWHWLGAPLDYFTARLTGLLLIWGALIACHRTLAAAGDRASAWLSVLPAAGCFATMTYYDLIHFSSEHLSLLLIAVAVGLLAGRIPQDRFRRWSGCFVAGLAPWAKLQVAPISVVLIVWGIWQGWKEAGESRADRGRRVAGIALAGVAPTLIALGLIAATGQMETAWRRYFLTNLVYVSDTRPLQAALGEMATLSLRDGRIPLFLGTMAAIALAAAAYYAIRRVRPPALFLPGLALSLAAFAAVITPHREFLHYALLLLVPLTIMVGALVGGWWQGLSSARARWSLAAVLFLAGGLPAVLTRCRQPAPEVYGLFLYQWHHPRTSVAEIIHALAQPPQTLGVWGWANHLYVETGLPQATSDTHSVWAINANSQRDYYRACYLADLRRNQPTVFVDAVGADAFAMQNRTTQGHESFPELAAYIRQNYTLVVDLGEARIYEANSAPARRNLTWQRITELTEKGRWRVRLNSTPASLTPLGQFQRKFIANQDVTMLLPPAAIEWALDDDVRQVSIEFGFDPVAYIRGSSDGAEVVLELVHGEQTRAVYRRFLDPAHRADDHGPQTAIVALPPFSSGTHLVLRSEPGPRGDTAWDWLYLANLEFKHSRKFLPTQFPGFTRVPDSVDASNSTLLDEDNARLFLMHAPGSLTYTLVGNETHLSFGFGFRAGAYSNGGHTDGAVFRVELERPGQPTRSLWTRHLQPVSEPADQGRQQADLTLSSIQPGDHLVVRIDTGPDHNAAWDWTYLLNLRLE